MEVIFNKILSQSGTCILYYLDWKIFPLHSHFWDFSNHFFLFGCELSLDGFCPGFVFLSGIKKVDVYKKFNIFKKILNVFKIAVEITGEITFLILRQGYS